MRSLLRGAVLISLLGLGACVQGPFATAPVTTPSGSSNHPRFAPPPGAQSQWDAALGVYVVSGKADLFYRERTYYSWDNGWYWSTQASGPWQAADSTAIPPGLHRRYAR